MSDRNELVTAIQKAASGPALSQAVAALDAYDQAGRDRAAADREVDLGARLAAQRLTPVPLHEHHTAATDWVLDVPDPADEGYRSAMIAQASTWYASLDPAVREDRDELAEQARGRARTLASVFGSAARSAESEFLQMVGYLQAQAASGLPQIQQTIDGNNMPAETPLPVETFENFAPPVDQFNTRVEDENHGSQISSETAPMIQQIRQQDSSGSGFGSGPERPDEHSTGDDFSNSYAEVPLGPPGQIGTAPAATDRQVGSTPNPIAGQPQDAGAERRTTAARDGYSPADPAGFRWSLTEIVHPFHARCASAHWPDEACGAQAHTASVAIGYAMDLDKARRLDQAEKIGAAEGRKAVQAAASPAALADFHNRVASACMASSPAEEDMAVLHGFMAVVRPVLAGPVTAADPGARTSRQASRLDFKQGAAAPGHDSCHICGGDADHTCEGCGRGVCDEHTTTARDGVAMCNSCQKPAGLPKGHEIYPPRSVTGASALNQVQQTVDPNNHPTPEDDQLPEGVMFPINPAWAAQWETTPGGPAPKGQAKEAAGSRMNGLPTAAAQYFGRMDALEGKSPHNKGNYPFSSKAHGQYLRSFNEVHATQAAVNGDEPLTREDYGNLTGRPDLHAHWQGHYDQARAARSQRSSQPMTAARREGDDNRCTDCGHRPGCDCPHDCDSDPSELNASQQRFSSLRTADMWSRPVPTTDDAAPVANGPQTAVQPQSANASPQDSDAAAGAAAGRADRAAGSRPAFADNSSAVSPYVKAYAEAYGGPAAPQNQDVPVSMGGDNGQAMLGQEAQQHVQTAQGIRREDLSKAINTPYQHIQPGDLDPDDEQALADYPDDSWKYPREDNEMEHPRHHAVLGDPDFIKGYGFASMWKPGAGLVAQGSRAFEAGLYIGITDRPEIQASWLRAHASQAARHPELGHRISRHQMLSVQLARKVGLRVQSGYVQAGVSTDLITDGPGTSPDPMGGTPLNGPGTPPPMGGRDEAATPGGAPPYQGAPPLPGGPVVPDQVMGPSQQPAQPDGPFTNTFSGDHPNNANLAPVAPNTAAQPGYSNKDAYDGAMPDRTARMAAFRQRVQAGIASMGAKQ
jgi:hypothetical protein